MNRKKLSFPRKLSFGKQLAQVSVILTFIAVFLFTAPTVFAQDVFRLKASEVINRDLIAGGEVVEISGTVNGDVYAGGGEVFVDGTVNGDLLVGGGKVNISGNVVQDLRVAGGQVTVSGEIGRNTTVVGGNIELTDSAILHGGLVTAGGNITVYSPVGKDVYIGAGNATLASTVGGNVTAGVGNLRVTSRAAVAGDLSYWSDTAATISETAKIGGKIHYNPTQSRANMPSRRFVHQASLAGKVFSALSTFVVGLLLMLFFPVIGRRSVSTLSARPLISFGVGLITIPVLGFIVLLLAVTILGIPLAILIVILYMIALYLFRIVFIYWIGSFVLRRLGDKEQPVWALTLGILIYMVILFIPYFGKLTTFIATFSGMGAVLLSRRSQPDPKVVLRNKKKRSS